GYVETVAQRPALRFVTDSATATIYTLSLHDALPISDTDEAAFTQETHSGAPVIFTLSEPFGARDWWPCKQDLNDKINTIDVYITDRKSTRLNSSHVKISYAVFCLKKKTNRT